MTPVSTVKENKDAKKLLPDTQILPELNAYGWLQSHVFMITSSILLGISVVILALSHRPGTSVWHDLTDGMPTRGELGFGKFLIFGTTIPFEYPFRLAFPSISAKLVPWLCYVPHQLGQFYILFTARRAKQLGKIDWTDGDKWNVYAWRMFRLNVFFILLHIWQSHVYYDGLAATFSELSTLFAGVSSILIAFMFEVKRRGLVFTWTPKTGRDLLIEFATFVKHYHGYLASFGMTLTFWYHTMEATFAHGTGFVHIFLLLWQSSLLYQKNHRNRYWTVVLEMWILIHGSVVAYYQGILDGVLYLMFLTSFTLLFFMGPFWGIPAIKKFLSDPKTKKARTIGLLIVTLSAYVVFAVHMFYSYGALKFLPMIFALPGLYYSFSAYYLLFYVLGKQMDNYFSKWLARDCWLRFIGIASWATASIWFIMWSSEKVFRLFVGYPSRP